VRCLQCKERVRRGPSSLQAGGAGADYAGMGHMQWDRERRNDPVRRRGGDRVSRESRSGSSAASHGRVTYRALSLVLPRLGDGAFAQLQRSIGESPALGANRWPDLLRHCAGVRRGEPLGAFEPTAPPTAMYDGVLRGVLDRLSETTLAQVLAATEDARAEHRDDADVRWVWAVVATYAERRD